jgi:peptide/nickel transport system substrate-binding protein
MMRQKLAGPFLLFVLSFFAPATERPVVYLRLTDSLTIDPGRIEDSYSQEVIFNVFEGLTRLRPDRMETEPCLAERWLTREDGRHWIFYLRRGVTFHNGAPFSARSVVYSFKKRLAKRTGEYLSFGRFFPYILDVRALDDWTVEFLLSRPYSQFPLALVDQRASIVAPGSCDGPQFKPVGTGPFVLSEWVRGKSMVLIRFDRYWHRPAKLAKVVIKYEPNAATRLAQIKNHGADIDFLKSAKEYDELLGRTDIAIISEPKLSTHFLGFNCRKAPFSSLPARQAIFHLLDRKIMVKQVFQNFAIPASSMLPPNSPGFNARIGGDDFSPEKARKLLRQAGLGDGFSCRLYYSEGQFGLEDVASVIATNARQIHIAVKRIRLPFAELMRAVREGEPDMFLLGWGFAADPGVHMNPMFMLYPGRRESTMSASPEFVGLLAQAEASADDSQRGGIYDAAQLRLHEDMPLIPLFYLNQVLAYNKRLRGLRMNPFGFLIFKDVYLGRD